jgi:hypothetical protein
MAQQQQPKQGRQLVTDGVEHAAAGQESSHGLQLCNRGSSSEQEADSDEEVIELLDDSEQEGCMPQSSLSDDDEEHAVEESDTSSEEIGGADDGQPAAVQESDSGDADAEECVGSAARTAMTRRRPQVGKGWVGGWVGE